MIEIYGAKHVQPTRHEHALNLFEMQGRIRQMLIYPTRNRDIEPRARKRKSTPIVDYRFVQQSVRAQNGINIQPNDLVGVLSQDAGGPVYGTSTDLQNLGTSFCMLHNK